MFDCYYYWLFQPIRGGIQDDSNAPATFQLNVVDKDGKSYELNFYCDELNKPHFARLKIDSIPSEDIPEKCLPLLQTVQEHMLSVLKLTFKYDITLAVPSSLYTFTPSGFCSNLNVSLDEHGDDIFDSEMTKNLFVHSFEIRELFRLYVDGNDSSIPIQYRFLSFYKLMELRYKDKGYWKHTELNQLIAEYESEFKLLGYSKKLLASIHELRDRCAHIKTGKGRELLGVTQLNHEAASKVNSMLPIMKRISAKIINDRVNGKFVLN